MKLDLAEQVTWKAFIAVALLAVTISAHAFTFGRYEQVRANGNVILIPQNKITGGKARFFRFDDGGKAVIFFVVRTNDGSYRTAFDACDVCYKEKKGYEQVGDEMICKNCDKHFAINHIAPSVEGGCNPAFLQHTLSKGYIVIKTSDLKAGKRLF